MIRIMSFALSRADCTTSEHNALGGCIKATLVRCYRSGLLGIACTHRLRYLRRCCAMHRPVTRGREPLGLSSTCWRSRTLWESFKDRQDDQHRRRPRVMSILRVPRQPLNHDLRDLACCNGLWKAVVGAHASEHVPTIHDTHDVHEAFSRLWNAYLPKLIASLEESDCFCGGRNQERERQQHLCHSAHPSLVPVGIPQLIMR